jgi:(1->4)-alpha-D-glucan 1-alpha-D-glucosylmutase
VVEKILAPDEELPEEFSCQGTTGYEFLNVLNSVFIDPAGARSLFRTYGAFTGTAPDFPKQSIRRKKQVIATLFAGDLRLLGNELIALASGDGSARKCSARELVQSLIEVTASLPVYRTYITARGIPAAGSSALQRAFDDASARAPLDPGVYAFLWRVLHLDCEEPEVRERWLDFVQRWQQFTGPVTAKGVEDTVFYTLNPLISLNEVGGAVEVPPAFR